MLKKGSTLARQENAAMRGGDGSVLLTHFLSKEEMNGKGRLFSRLTLNPGCSIGFHVHNNESEIFFVESGCGEFDDNGTVQSIEAGDVTVTPSGSGHAVRCTGDVPLQLIALIIYE